MTEPPQDLRDIIKGTIDGIIAFVESEVIPLEHQYQDVLAHERKLFGPDGKLVPEIRQAREDIRAKSGKAGYWAMFSPESLGGGGLPVPVSIYVQEALYRKYGPGHLLMGWANGFITTPLIASFVDGPSHMFTMASEAIRTDVVPSLIAGEKTICFALTEPDAGSDLWNLKCKARKEGDEWVINGAKQWITNSPYADYAAVFAVTNDQMLAEHKGGITGFLVDTRQPGVDTSIVFPIMGHLSSDCGSVVLEDVRVKDEYILGEVDQGFRISMMGISEGRLNYAAGCLGLAEWALDRSLEYAKERRTFGRALSDHQAIQWMLADSAIDIFTAKYAALQTARLVEESQAAGRVPIKEISIVKAYMMEMAQRVCDRAIQIHGAMGLSSEMGLEEAFRIARTWRIPDGTSEMQRRTIARQLLRGDAVF
ncbi:MAG: acyl-CoA dehydrogenase family protein [Dehalococcoidia bacterium]